MVQMKRRTRSEKRRRASHFALKRTSFTKCSHCGKAVLPHRACQYCGYYRGRVVLEVEAKLLKKMEKEKAKREKETKKEEKEQEKEEKKNKKA